ncbi:hypothetical protein GBA52_003630 [Prunus armeniaca]|nr:hypothetical protein GBA52_003630 [Prunus armeniaca]
MTHRRTSLPGPMVRWRSPLPGYYKLNVGDVIDLKDGARVVAVVVCDSCGVLKRCSGYEGPWSGVRVGYRTVHHEDWFVLCP